VASFTRQLRLKQEFARDRDAVARLPVSPQQANDAEHDDPVRETNERHMARHWYRFDCYFNASFTNHNSPTRSFCHHRTPEEQVIVFVEHETIRKAKGFIKSCEQCNLDGAEWPFNAVLDRVTGSSDP
jgi:hypothetical protein